MKNKFAFIGVVSLSLMSSVAFAQSGNIAIPGLFSGKGSVGSDITNSKINVTGNTAKNVTVGGGKVGIKIAEVSMDGVANVNSVNITGSRVKDSEINVTGNTADNIKAFGGTANVNSVNIN